MRKSGGQTCARARVERGIKTSFLFSFRLTRGDRRCHVGVTSAASHQRLQATYRHFDDLTALPFWWKISFKWEMLAKTFAIWRPLWWKYVAAQCTAKGNSHCAKKNYLMYVLASFSVFTQFLLPASVPRNSNLKLNCCRHQDFTIFTAVVT